MAHFVIIVATTFIISLLPVSRANAEQQSIHLGVVTRFPEAQRICRSLGQYFRRGNGPWGLGFADIIHCGIPPRTDESLFPTWTIEIRAKKTISIRVCRSLKSGYARKYLCEAAISLPLGMRRALSDDDTARHIAAAVLAKMPIVGFLPYAETRDLPRVEEDLPDFGKVSPAQIEMSPNHRYYRVKPLEDIDAVVDDMEKVWLLNPQADEQRKDIILTLKRVIAEKKRKKQSITQSARAEAKKLNTRDNNSTDTQKNDVHAKKAENSAVEDSPEIHHSALYWIRGRGAYLSSPWPTFIPDVNVFGGQIGLAWHILRFSIEGEKQKSRTQGETTLSANNNGYNENQSLSEQSPIPNILIDVETIRLTFLAGLVYTSGLTETAFEAGISRRMLQQKWHIDRETFDTSAPEFFQTTIPLMWEVAASTRLASNIFGIAMSARYSWGDTIGAQARGFSVSPQVLIGLPSQWLSSQITSLHLLGISEIGFDWYGLTYEKNGSSNDFSVKLPILFFGGGIECRF